MGLLAISAGFIFAQTEREQGVELYKQGKYQEAIKLFKQATKKRFKKH